MEMKGEKRSSRPKKGLWKPEEDMILRNYVQTHGEGKWASVSQNSGLKRGGKSCRLRWKNYLRPNIKRGKMSDEEKDLIIRLHKLLGNRWSLIAGRLPGRTDNEVKNYWNTHLNKKAISPSRCKRTCNNRQLQLPLPTPPSTTTTATETNNPQTQSLHSQSHSTKEENNTLPITSGIPDPEIPSFNVEPPFLPPAFHQQFFNDEEGPVGSLSLFEAFQISRDETYWLDFEDLLVPPFSAA
ncbi:hypothetical protein NMG60_11021723 [Bertholletia excelsa]